MNIHEHIFLFVLKLGAFFEPLKKWIWCFLFLVGLCFYALLPFNPVFTSYIDRDSGVFLYIGWRMMEGELPYLDVWDHKPAMIFFINALGFLLSSDRGGVWLLEFVFLFIALLIGFRLIQKIMGIFPAILASWLWIYTFSALIGGGNFTEEYALPFQFASLWFFYQFDERNQRKISLFWVGFFAGCAFLTKQTTIGILIAIFLLITTKRIANGQVRCWLSEIWVLSSGVFLPILITSLFFACRGALLEFIDAAFLYNFAYTSFFMDEKMSRFGSILVGVFLHSRSGILFFVLSGLLLGLLYSRQFLQKNALILLAVIALPIELVLSGWSGRGYLHYYISALPVLAVLSALSARPMLFLFAQTKSLKVKRIFFIGVIGALFSVMFFDARNKLHVYQSLEARFTTASMASIVASLTTPEQTVLLWGAETSVNYLSQRISPTRFVYQYPLYQPGYATETMILQFLDDILDKKPAYIIDTKNSLTPIFDFPIQTSAIAEKTARIQSLYHLTRIESSWVFYEYIGSDR